MALIESWVKCEMSRAVQVQYLQGNLFSADNQGNLVGVRVFENGEPASISGSVSANVIRADGTTVPVAGTLTNGNECYVILPQAAYAVTGVVTIVIKITTSSVVTTLAAIVSTVYASTTDAIVDPGTIIPSIETLIAAIEAAVATIPADYSSLWATIAPAYTSLTFPVSKGQYCTDNGHMYRAKQDIATSESFTSSHWEVCNVGVELFNQIGAGNQAISELKSALSEETRNLWLWGNQDVTGGKKVADNITIPAGTYTVSAQIDRYATDGNCRMFFYKNTYSTSQKLAEATIMSGQARGNATITLAEDSHLIRIASGPSESSTATANWHDIQLESGSIVTDYVPPITAKDCEARNQIESNNKADRNAKNNYSSKGINTSEWEQGSLNYVNGADWEATTRIRTKGFISIDDGVIGVSAETGYELAVFAWDNQGTYIGALSNQGTFTKTSIEWVKEYWFDNYPEYKFKIVLGGTARPAVDVSVSENVNCMYRLCRYASAEWAGQIQDDMDELFPANLITEQPSDAGGIFVANGNVTSSETLVHTDYIDVEGIEQLIYTRIYTNAKRAVWGMAFYDSSKEYISGQPPVINNKTFTYGYSELEVPEGAKYARFSWYTPLGDFELYDAESYSGAITNRIEKLEKEVEEIKKETNTLATIGLHTEPENVGQLNVIKRCRQLTDIKWTPSVDLPRLMMVQRSGIYDGTVTAQEYEGVFKAGIEYTGIPYGRANDLSDYGYSHGFVGKDIDFETFITSVTNPESMLCKESQFDLSDHESTKYACVCSALTTYALNVPYKTTAQIPSITGLVRIGKINDNGTLISEDSFKLGDVLNITGYHTAIVTDICKDEDGHLLFIELSDASTAGLADKNHADGQIGGVCRRKGWTKDQIYAAGSWGDYDLYRYQYIEDVPYTPSQYVNVGDELNMWRIEQMPCMPYPGNGFVYDKDNIPNTDIIIAPNLGYSCLRVFKDGTEITGSPFAITSETTKVSTGFSAEGNYIAYLSTMQNGHDKYVSCKCSWSVKS